MAIIYFFIFLFGLCIGSSLNAWLWRLHRDESMFGRRSYCPKCKKQLRNFDLIPLLSFLFLGGKCRFCRKKISWQYPLVELTAAILFVLSFNVVVSKIGVDLVGQIYLWLYWYFIAILIVIFVFDLKYYLILDKVSLPAMLIIFLVNLFFNPNWTSWIIGGIAGAGFFAAQYFVSKGEWVGGGDIRLGGLIGLMLGWQGLLITLFIAYVIGAIVGIILILTKQKTLQSKIPFGPFLCSGAIIALLWGEQIVTWYFKTAGI